MGVLKPSAPLRALCGAYVFGTCKHTRRSRGLTGGRVAA